MQLTGKRLAERVSQLRFPLSIFAATGNSVAAFVEKEEFAGMALDGEIVAVATNSKVRRVRFLSDDRQVLHGKKMVPKPSRPTPGIKSVDLVRSEAGNSSWVMRIVGRNGLLIQNPGLRQAA